MCLWWKALKICLYCFHLKAFDVLCIIKGIKNVIESELWCICEETLFLYSALSTVEVEDNPNLNILLIVFEEFFNTVIRLWHWKIFLLLWRVLCFKIRCSYSWKPCNLLACKPHLYHRCSEVLSFWSEITLLWTYFARVLFITGATGLKVKVSSSGNI